MQFSGRTSRLVSAAAAAALAGHASAATASEGVNPIQKVLEMIAGLEQKQIADGEKAQKVYDDAAESCEDRSTELHHEVKVAKAQAENLEAVIEKNTDDVDSLSTKIEELSSTISTDEKDLKAATDLRTSEKATFDSAEAELKSTIDTLERAIGILEKGGASLLQSDDGSSAMAGADKFAQTLQVMVEASGLSTADSTRLTALLQNTDSDSSDDSDSLEDEDGDETLGAPDGAAYEGKSGEGSPLVKTMNGLLEKANEQLQETREQEVTRQNNYNMLKQSLSTKIQYATSDLAEAKAAKGEAAEKQATAEGALSVTKKDLAEDIKALSELHRDCMTRAADFEEETRSRGEELKALAQAKKVIAETTGGAEEESYASAAASFVQVAMKRRAQKSGEDHSEWEFDVEAVKLVRQLAFKKKSVALSQLAERMENTVREGNALGDDIFGKVKGMLTDMIGKLEKEADEDAEHQGFCTKEMGETQENQADKSGEVEKLTTKIDTMTSEVTKLKKEVATTNGELAKLAQWQGKMNNIRQEEKAIFETKSTDLKKGIKGLQLALKVLRDYYSKDEDAAHDSDEGTGGSIIGLLEVCESDFTKGLSEIEAEEETAISVYEKETQENAVLKAEKEQDATYKTKESKALSKAIAEFSSDRDGAQTELDAVNDYMAKLKEQCVAKPEPYEERKKRREKEMQGLQDAMKKLSGEAVFLQLSSTRHSLRGVARHDA